MTCESTNLSTRIERTTSGQSCYPRPALPPAVSGTLRNHKSCTGPRSGCVVPRRNSGGQVSKPHTFSVETVRKSPSWQWGPCPTHPLCPTERSGHLPILHCQADARAPFLEASSCTRAHVMMPKRTTKIRVGQKNATQNRCSSPLPHARVPKQPPGPACAASLWFSHVLSAAMGSATGASHAIMWRHRRSLRAATPLFLGVGNLAFVSAPPFTATRLCDPTRLSRPAPRRAHPYRDR